MPKALKEFLREKSVIELYSPPHQPSYNGSIEATIGSLKKRTDQQAAWAGRSRRLAECRLGGGTGGYEPQSPAQIGWTHTRRRLGGTNSDHKYGTCPFRTGGGD